jgi:uncharacterized membrane protein YGL010W
MALLSTRSWHDWIRQYAESHRHPVNRACHTLGIPLVAASAVALPVSLFVPGARPLALSLFALGWTAQFVGHAFERKLPEFFHDARFLLVGLRWWVAKVRGRA